MKATGIVRRIDDLGRVVIPKEIRRTMRIREGDPSQTQLLYVRFSQAHGSGIVHIDENCPFYHAHPRGVKQQNLVKYRRRTHDAETDLLRLS